MLVRMLWPLGMSQPSLASAWATPVGAQLGKRQEQTRKQQSWQASTAQGKGERDQLDGGCPDTSELSDGAIGEAGSCLWACCVSSRLRSGSATKVSVQGQRSFRVERQLTPAPLCLPDSDGVSLGCLLQAVKLTPVFVRRAISSCFPKGEQERADFLLLDACFSLRDAKETALLAPQLLWQLLQKHGNELVCSELPERFYCWFIHVDKMLPELRSREEEEGEVEVAWLPVPSHNQSWSISAIPPAHTRDPAEFTVPEVFLSLFQPCPNWESRKSLKKRNQTNNINEQHQGRGKGSFWPESLAQGGKSFSSWRAFSPCKLPAEEVK
ncbi:uncharacterized protein LOC136022779 [Lathamus discolor]|uniref:uncharacterized protein LOC136022779 n=1 Tax=Lathamus discolor TaxID=678569 RepID=UPI0032B74506